MANGDLRKREGKFRPSLLGRMDAIQALKEWGWSWRQIAAHFSEDVGLGGASGEHFRSEWNQLGRRGAMPDRAEVARMKRAMMENTNVQDAWVQRARVKAPRPVSVPKPVAEAVKPVPVSARPAVERLPVVSEPGVVERHRMASAAGGVSSSFPVSGKPEAEREGAASEPIVYSAETLARLEVRLLMAGDHLTAAEFMSELDFPRPVAEAAVFEQRKVKAIRGPQPVLTLFRRLAFHMMVSGKPEALAFVERLPGASEWVALRREGVRTYEEAAKRLGG